MAKYDALREHLNRRSGVVHMTFDEVSAIVPGGLPRSARTYQAWWNNDDSTHPHCHSWGEAGYRAVPDISRGEVRFEPRL